MLWSLVALTLGGLAALIAVVLMAQVRLEVKLQRREKLQATARIQALYGLVNAELPRQSAPSTTQTCAEPSRHKLESEPPPQTSPPVALRHVFVLLRSPGFARALVRYLRRLRRALRIDELNARVRVGFDDPAETGWLWGVLGPVGVVLMQRYPEFELAPSFERPCLDLDAHGRIAIVPLQVLLITVAFVATPATLRAAVRAWRSG